MTLYETTNQTIINYYEDYKNIKKLITEMKLLYNHLIENKIIKQSQNYIALYNDKFGYSSASKLDKILLKDFITSEQKEFHKNITYKYCDYFFNLIDGGLMKKQNRNYDMYNTETLTQFKLYKLREYNKIIKKLIKYEITNKAIRII